MRKILFSLFLTSLGVGLQAQTTTVFQENFNSYSTGDTPTNWTLIDADGDTRNWTVVQFQDQSQNPTGTPVLVSDSWIPDPLGDPDGIPLTPDNWIITPSIDLTTVPQGSVITVEWKVAGVDPDYSDENYSVYVAAGNTVNDFISSSVSLTEVVTDNGPGGLVNLYTKTLSASSFIGQSIYVAFRHHNITNEFRLAIDDVRVYYTGGGNPDPDPVLPVADFTASSLVICEGDCIDFTDNSTENPTSWAWVFPGSSMDSSNVQNPTNVCYNTAGTYGVTLTVTNNDGSDTKIETTYITVNPLPTTPTISAIGDSLTSSATTGNQWYFEGTAIDGATGQTHTAAQDGSYTVMATDTNGCSSVMSDEVVVQTSGIGMFAQQDLTIYPNPSNGIFTINSNFEILTVEIFDILGNKVMESIHLNNGNGQIDASQLNKGIYLVKVNHGANSYTERMVLK